MRETTQAVLNALLHMEHLASTPEGLEELNHPSLGICSIMLNVLAHQLGHNTPEHHRAYDLWNNTQKHLFQDWPEFSGHEAYPVKVEPFDSPKGYGPMVTASDQFNGAITMFGVDAYGEARLRLLSYLIDNFRMALK